MYASYIRSCSIYLLRWVFALPIGSGAHSRPAIKWFHACCKWMYALRSGEVHIHCVHSYNDCQNMPKFASMRRKSLKCYTCWQLLHLSLESRGTYANPQNFHLMVSRWLLMSPIVSSHSTALHTMHAPPHWLNLPTCSKYTKFLWNTGSIWYCVTNNFSSKDVTRSKTVCSSAPHGGGLCLPHH